MTGGRPREGAERRCHDWATNRAVTTAYRVWLPSYHCVQRPPLVRVAIRRDRECCRCATVSRRTAAAYSAPFEAVSRALQSVATTRRGSRRRPAFRRAKRSAPHRQQMEAERCATVNYFRSALYFSHPLTLQYERDAVSGKLAVSIFLHCRRNGIFTLAPTTMVSLRKAPIPECCHVGSNGGKR